MKRVISLFMLVVFLLGVMPAYARVPDSFCGAEYDSDTTKIDFGKNPVQDTAALVSFLDRMPKLVQVDMYQSRLSYEDMDMLADRYGNITFGWTVKMGDHELRTDATAFSTLHSKDSKLHRNEDFRSLKFCKNLLALDIGHNLVSDLSFLTYLPKLKILILACNKINDISLIGELHDLEYLEIFNNQITDLSPLKNCTNLLDLNICFNYVADLTPLYGLRKLERLWVYKCNKATVSNTLVPEDFENLRQALPKSTNYNTTSYSTLGGWRDHDRYFVLAAIFQMGVYQPWDFSDSLDKNGLIFYPAIDIEYRKGG